METRRINCKPRFSKLCETNLVYFFNETVHSPDTRSVVQSNLSGYQEAPWHDMGNY